MDIFPLALGTRKTSWAMFLDLNCQVVEISDFKQNIQTEFQGLIKTSEFYIKKSLVIMPVFLKKKVRCYTSLCYLNFSSSVPTPVPSSIWIPSGRMLVLPHFARYLFQSVLYCIMSVSLKQKDKQLEIKDPSKISESHPPFFCQAFLLGV